MTLKYTVRTAHSKEPERFIVAVDVDANSPAGAAEKRIRGLAENDRTYDSGAALVTSRYGDALIFKWTRSARTVVDVELRPAAAS